MPSDKPARPALSVALACLAATVVLTAQGLTNYDELYAKYLAEARRPATAQAPLWMVNLTRDPRASRPNDLLTIRVVESLIATGSADSTVNKASAAEVTVPTPAARWISKAIPASAETTFAGSGGTTRTSELFATITARVLDVLPNGDLVVEGVREVDINGDRSVVVLTGVVRATDVGRDNVVLSTTVGQLRIRSLSRGLIKDSLAPGWLIRALNKVF